MSETSIGRDHLAQLLEIQQSIPDYEWRIKMNASFPSSAIQQARTPSSRIPSAAGSLTMNSRAVGDGALVAAAFLLSSMAGTGIYQHVVVMPSWFENPPESFKKIRQYGNAEVRFWVPAQALTLASLVAAYAASKQEPMRRSLVLATGAGYVAVAIATAAYFAPKILKWGNLDWTDTPAQDLKSSGQRWLALSWLREATLATGALLALGALATRRGDQ